MPTEPALFKQFLPVIKVTGGGGKELSIWCFFEIRVGALAPNYLRNSEVDGLVSMYGDYPLIFLLKKNG